MHICQKYMTFSSFTHFCRESKSVAIYALYPESFCVKFFAIRKVFAFSDSANHGSIYEQKPQIIEPLPFLQLLQFEPQSVISAKYTTAHCR